MSSKSPLPLPQVLTPSVASTLIANLDASDVLECYSLSRTVRLGGFHNVTIQKMAIGLRYGGSAHKPPLELTLEYGPGRIGSQMQDESMPLVITDNHLSWDNEGKVYFTTAAIRSYKWKSAYYMSSLTGAVLEKILEKAALYAKLKPRYQPFSVVVSSDAADAPRLKHVLKSSSSVDFCIQTLSDMVDLGVDLTPILSPPTFIPRLHVSGKVLKVSGYTNDGLYVPELATHFFQSFSKCWEAIATGDFSSYETGMPSVAPSIASPMASLTERPSNSPQSLQPSIQSEMLQGPSSLGDTGSPTDTFQENQRLVNQTKSNRGKRMRNETGQYHGSDSENGETIRARDLIRATPNRKLGTEWSLWQQHNPKLSRRLLDESMQQHDDSENNDHGMGESAFHNLTLETTATPSSNISTLSPSLSPTGDTASEAQKAADEAHAAAQQAKNASTHESAERAADAAEHAADAAQKAANAARWQKDMESMNSGDGALVAQALQRCWTDPLYGMATGNSTTIVGYMYLDGNFYFQMNLTPPYFDILEAQMQIPQPLDQTNGSMLTPDNFVDWTLAFCIMGFFLVGLFAFFQQFGLRLAFYKRQKFFFDPTNMRSGDEDDGTHCCSSSKRMRRVGSESRLFYGEGSEHGFAEDVIPLSMGGRRPFARNTSLLVTNSPTAAPRHLVDFDDDGHLELVDVSTSLDLLDFDEQLGLVATSPSAQVPPPRFTRDPDLVDMPSLRSRSKVARPVTLDSLESNDSLASE